MFYTGIGSRKTPESVMKRMSTYAKVLNRLSWTLRSGGAEGADIAFESGAGELKEIFLPWKGFNGSNSNLTYTKDAELLAEKYHPNWSILTIAGRKLMARNVHQVLGKDLKSPSTFLICYTEGGKMLGGTAQALRIARDYKIKVFNLGSREQEIELNAYLRDLIQSHKLA